LADPDSVPDERAIVVGVDSLKLSRNAIAEGVEVGQLSPHVNNLFRGLLVLSYQRDPPWRGSALSTQARWRHKI